MIVDGLILDLVTNIKQWLRHALRDKNINIK